MKKKASSIHTLPTRRSWQHHIMPYLEAHDGAQTKCYLLVHKGLLFSSDVYLKDN